MAKRKVKNHKGIHKKELQNEPLKFLVNSHEQDLLNNQVKARKHIQSEYLRYLLLYAPHRSIKEKECSYTETITDLGRRLNEIAKNINQAVLREETIVISTEETIFGELEEALDNLTNHIAEIQEDKTLVRDIQIKFLVTSSQLAAAQAKLKTKKLSLSRYMRQQIVGCKDTKYKTKAREITGKIGRLNNNVDQVIKAIWPGRYAYRMTIIADETTMQILNLQQKIENLQQQLL